MDYLGYDYIGPFEGLVGKDKFALILALIGTTHVINFSLLFMYQDVAH